MYKEEEETKVKILWSHIDLGSLIHSLKEKNVLSTHSLPGNVLGSGNAGENIQATSLPSCNLRSYST